MIFSYLLITFSLLVANVSNPWTTFWMEFTAGLGVLLGVATLFLNKKLLIQKNIAIVIVIFSIFLAIDYLLRNNIYHGDNLIAFLYIYFFLISICFGWNFNFSLERYAFFCIFVAIFCIGILLAQWIGIDLDKMYFRELAPGARVYANMGQPNHLATVLVWSGVLSIFLNSEKKLSDNLTIVFLVLIAFSQSLTQSRTSFLSLLVTFFVAIFLFKESGRSVPIRKIGLWMACVLFFSTMLPLLQEVLDMRAERSLYEMGVGTSRTAHWLSMLDAVAKKPIFGYGWLHAAEAHITGTNYAIKESIFQYSHNLILDVTLWAGIPFGIIISFVIFWGVVSCLRSSLSTSQKYSFLLVVVFLVHCMLEFPYAYLHLLIPAGIFVGHCCHKNNSNEQYLSRFHSAIILMIGVFLSLIVVYDYWGIEKKTTALRFEYAKIYGGERLEEGSDVIILDQAKALVEHTYREPARDISAEIIKKNEKATYRYGTQRLLFHSAMVHGFNNDQESSKKFLREICKIHSKSSCEFSKNQWNILKLEYPENIGKIDFPEI
ncbi:MAG: Wzy polymerase domain-containing protein [Comamonas testosteroni]